MFVICAGITIQMSLPRPSSGMKCRMTFSGVSRKRPSRIVQSSSPNPLPPSVCKRESKRASTEKTARLYNAQMTRIVRPDSSRVGCGHMLVVWFRCVVKASMTVQLAWMQAADACNRAVSRHKQSVSVGAQFVVGKSDARHCDYLLVSQCFTQ